MVPHCSLVDATAGFSWFNIGKWSSFVANILIRDIHDELLAPLKTLARRHGRSLQAEIHNVLERAAVSSLAETRRLAARWLKRLAGSSQSDSTRLIREDRNA